MMVQLLFVFTTFFLVAISGVSWCQEGAATAAPGIQVPVPETYNVSGLLIDIPPVPLAYTYPGPLPIPGASWPYLGGIGYTAEGRFPYNGYIGFKAPYLKLLERRKYDNYQSKAYGDPSAGYGGSGYASGGGSYAGGGSYGMRGNYGNSPY